MDVSTIYSSSSSQAVDPVELFKKWADNNLRSTTSSGDTVNISDAGRALLAQSQSVQASPLLGLDTLGDQTDDAADDITNASASAEETDFTSALTTSEDQTTETNEIEDRIAELTDQLASLMQGSLPQDQRTQQVQPIQAQIEALEMQLGEMNVAGISEV